MTPSKEDVKQWLKSNGKNREWLAGQCGVDKRTVDLWLSRARNIPARALLIIQKLIESETDPGEIHLPLTEQQWRIICEAMKGQTFLQFVNEALKNAAQEQAQNTAPPTPPPSPSALANDLYAEEEETSPSYYETEILGNIAAGGLMEGDSDPEPVRLYRPLNKGEYVVRVNGRSMEPAIPDGALIILKKYYSSDIPKIGAIVEYNDGRGVTLKRLGKQQGAYILESVNPHYPDIEPIDGGCISALYVETLPE